MNSSSRNHFTSILVRYYYGEDIGVCVPVKPIRIALKESTSDSETFEAFSIGKLPVSVEVFCNRSDGSLSINETHAEPYCVIPKLGRMLPLSECLIVSSDDETRTTTPDSIVGSDSIASDVSSAWESLPSTDFFMPTDDSRGGFACWFRRHFDRKQHRSTQSDFACNS